MSNSLESPFVCLVLVLFRIFTFWNVFHFKVVCDKVFVSFFFSLTKRYPVTEKTSSESRKVCGTGETCVLGSKIQWMWLIRQRETDNNRASEQKERASVMWALMSVCCKSSSWVWCVCVFFFLGVARGSCFFLFPGAVRIIMRGSRRGLSFSPCFIALKTKLWSL